MVERLTNLVRDQPIAVVPEVACPFPFCRLLDSVQLELIKQGFRKSRVRTRQPYIPPVFSCGPKVLRCFRPSA